MPMAPKISPVSMKLVVALTLKTSELVRSLSVRSRSVVFPEFLTSMVHVRSRVPLPLSFTEAGLLSRPRSAFGV